MTESLRYDRQIRLPMIGLDGQQRIGNSRVMVLGAGALGTVAAELLVRAGVGMLRIVDRDTVDWTNLQRQSLYDENDAANQAVKVAAAAERLRQINSQPDIEAIACDVDAGNIIALVEDVDMIIDASDNFATRFLLNEAAVKLNKPWVHGGCVATQGQVGVFLGNRRPCFQCIVPSAPPPGTVATCDTAGVLNAATHVIASLQVAEAIKLMVGGETSLSGKLLSVDLWNARFSSLQTSALAAADCPVCSRGEFALLQGEVPSQAKVLCGRNAVQIPATQRADFDSIARQWSDLGDVHRTAFTIRLTLDEHAITVFTDGRTIVEGTDEVSKARTLHARYVGQ